MPDDGRDLACGSTGATSAPRFRLDRRGGARGATPARRDGHRRATLPATALNASASPRSVLPVKIAASANVSPTRK